MEACVLLLFFFFLFFPVFSAPCRIQWHSFLMRLLSLLISVSSAKMNDSRPCNKYNMRCINFSENKNGRLPLLYPFQMFRFMAFSMSASFSNFAVEIYFHLINEQLRKRGVYSQNLHTKGHVFDESSWLRVCMCVYICRCMCVYVLIFVHMRNIYLLLNVNTYFAS